MLQLDKIADHLQALEETILYRLIDRVQYKMNADIYVVGAHHFKDFRDKSLVEIRMRYQQDMESVFGRFSVPEERPFLENLKKEERRFRKLSDDLKI